jgi:putative membrane protein
VDLVAAAEAGPAVAADLVAGVPVEIGNFPSWARGILKPEDREKISEAVRRAEIKTTGEIVPMIVQKSSVSGHVALMMTLVFLVIILVLEVPQLDIFEELNAYWLLFFVGVGSFLISQYLSRFMWAQVPDLQE